MSFDYLGLVEQVMRPLLAHYFGAFSVAKTAVRAPKRGFLPSRGFWGCSYRTLHRAACPTLACLNDGVTSRRVFCIVIRVDHSTIESADTKQSYLLACSAMLAGEVD